jgi:predicted transcriptional regulator
MFNNNTDIPRQKMRRTEGFEPLVSALKRIEKKVDLLVNGAENERLRKKPEETVVNGSLDVVTLLSLPDHLRKSAMTVMKLGKAMAKDVARETGRARAIESAYLNQLTRMGYMQKSREGRRVYFLTAGTP